MQIKKMMKITIEKKKGQDRLKVKDECVVTSHVYFLPLLSCLFVCRFISPSGLGLRSPERRGGGGGSGTL